MQLQSPPLCSAASGRSSAESARRPFASAYGFVGRGAACSRALSARASVAMSSCERARCRAAGASARAAVGASAAAMGGEGPGDARGGADVPGGSAGAAVGCGAAVSAVASEPKAPPRVGGTRTEVFPVASLPLAPSGSTAGRSSPVAADCRCALMRAWLFRRPVGERVRSRELCQLARPKLYWRKI